MKAIVANVLFGSILGCLSWTNSACASPQSATLPGLEVPTTPIVSAKRMSSDTLPIVPQIINLVDRIFTVNKSDTHRFYIDSDAPTIFDDTFRLYLQANQGLNLGNLPYTHRDRKADVVLGFQKTFWPSQHQQKYWGVTTIEHWGDNSQPKQKLKLAKLNYTNVAPSLRTGNSILTVSGGGNHNLATKTHTSQEFEQFRGGFTYHHGIIDHVTMGVGLVYEDYVIGFTQLTYDSDSIPLKTTVSLLAKESGLDFRSHVRLQPVQNLTLNYYHQKERDQVDANLNLIPGLTLTAKSDSKDDSLTTGINMAVNTQYLSISAKAAMDRDRNLQWKLKSQIGGLKFSHSSNQKKSDSQINLNLLDADITGFQCSAFVKYQTRQAKNEQKDFTIWGSQLHSAQKISPNKHLWTIDFGYGSGNHGSGIVASSSVSLNPNLSFKLSYQEISPTSDDTKIKLQLTSR